MLPESFSSSRDDKQLERALRKKAKEKQTSLDDLVRLQTHGTEEKTHSEVLFRKDQNLC